MNVFENVKFKGTFRDYQARVLNGLDKYFHDNKLNIVAAPGSGKTILGLEIIRKLGSKCIILSPTTTIKSQWGERFKDFFLPENSKPEDYISFDLNNIKPITSITYQALYSAMSKIKCETEEETIDYSKIDLFKLIKENEINTICLDEAHHLQNEWQKSLEKFISGLDKNIKIISLTATPPYDATPAEWKRYTETCGEIDEEIFIPELVKQNNLCPHQDYIYFNFPTETELKELETYLENVDKTMQSLTLLPFFHDVSNKIFELYKNEDEYLYENVDSIVAVLVLINNLSVQIDPRVIKALTTHKKLPAYNINYAETGLQFLVNSDKFLPEDERTYLYDLFKTAGLVDKNKISLNLNDKLSRKIISSVGKIESIKKIAKFENSQMKENLRMLILTDFIKKEGIKNIGSGNKFNSISVISIFESLRTEIQDSPMAVLSGTTIILPNEVVKELKLNKKLKFSYQEILRTNYSCVNFLASNREKVEIVGNLFEQGKIRILIGTKSLLGEGWDSPCINTLILASFVGSFMLSNQMRGRAIRINKKDPNKTANIWHLVTIEPEYLYEQNETKFVSDDEPKSNDYDTLKRRFDSFMGPDYETNEIVSGIERIKIIKPPYDEEGIKNINSKMLELAADRERLTTGWNESLEKTTTTTKTMEVPTEKSVPRFSLAVPPIIYTCLMFAILATGITLLVKFLSENKFSNLLLCIVSVILILILSKKFIKSLINLFSHINPQKSVKTIGKCVLKTLKEIDIIESDCKIKVKSKDKKISLSLDGASVYEQNLFNNALKEIYSTIDNPRYLIIKTSKIKGYNYSYSFACPTVIAQKKEYAENLAYNLSKHMPKMNAVYTRNENGRKLILKCRQKSYITFSPQNIKSANRVI